MISIILITLLLSIEWTQSWWGTFFHGVSPMYTCRACHSGNQRGKKCFTCDNRRASERREEYVERHTIESAVVKCKRCGDSELYACQDCLDRRNVVD